jgi:putative peptidoglycan lipid II flippase
MLNARGVFGVPALAPALLNAGMIVFGLSLMPLCRAIGQPPIVAMALGVVLGAALQFACQLPALHRQGFRPAFEWPTWPPGVRRVALLMGPATIGLAATNVNVIVASRIASSFVEGSVTWLYCAFRLMQLPIGVFGVALATVSLPALSRAAVAEDMPQLKNTLSATLRLVFLLTLPAALWLAVMGRPLVALLYEHGRFLATDTERTAAALVMYCIGLPAYAAQGVLSRTFYALGDARRPVQASFVSVALNLALNLALMRPLGHLGLALSASLTACVNVLQLGWYLRARIGPLGARRMVETIARVLFASLVPCGLLFAALLAMRDRWHGSLLVEAAVVAAGIAIALPLGWLMMKAMRVAELEAAENAAGALVRRFTGRP